LRLSDSVSCSAFRVLCSVFHVPCSMFHVPCSVFCVPCSVFCVLRSVLRVPCSAFRVPCSAFCVPRSAFCVQCSVFRVPCSVFGNDGFEGSRKYGMSNTQFEWSACSVLSRLKLNCRNQISNKIRFYFSKLLKCEFR